jgi:hypothetical protein
VLNNFIILVLPCIICPVFMFQYILLFCNILKAFNIANFWCVFMLILLHEILLKMMYFLQTMEEEAPASSRKTNDRHCRRCRPTRSTNRTGDWHRHSSKIHRAIEARELSTVKKLLENGEKFCTGDGLNCIILAALSPNGITRSRWKFVTEMLGLDASCINNKNEGAEFYLKCLFLFLIPFMFCRWINFAHDLLQ